MQNDFSYLPGLLWEESRRGVVMVSCQISETIAGHKKEKGVFISDAL
jgi:hypothetical protein